MIEVDEAYSGGEKPCKRGRGSSGKTLVLTAAQIVDGRKYGRIRLRRVSDASAASFEQPICETVEPGSIIHTDGWRVYNGLDRRDYIHEIVREKAELGEQLLPYCHRIAALLKK